MTPPPLLGYFYGDDTYGLERAVDALAARLASDGAAAERWRTTGAETSAAAISERVATSPLFGGGVLAVVSEPAPLLRSRADQDLVAAAVRATAPGNGLVFVEPNDGSGRRSQALIALQAVISAAGGEARELRAPRDRQLTGWIEARARERWIRLGKGAAAEIARRVGGFVREGDVDRRGQSTLAVAELDKLAIYRLEGEVEVDDVRALVSEVVPDSTWALLDAVADRRTGDASGLLDRLLETTPEPLLLVQIHRRIRELIEVADHLEHGATPASLVRTLRLKPFRADKLAGQARRWRAEELELALAGLLELDAMVKGAPDAATSERQRRLAFAMWLEERVAPR
ncbi:MAG: DNA polymerase III subunit delta [Chloroflexota bacterium]